MRTFRRKRQNVARGQRSVDVDGSRDAGLWKIPHHTQAAGEAEDDEDTKTREITSAAVCFYLARGRTSSASLRANRSTGARFLKPREIRARQEAFRRCGNLFTALEAFEWIQAGPAQSSDFATAAGRTERASERAPAGSIKKLSSSFVSFPLLPPGYIRERYVLHEYSAPRPNGFARRCPRGTYRVSIVRPSVVFPTQHGGVSCSRVTKAEDRGTFRALVHAVFAEFGS